MNVFLIVILTVLVTAIASVDFHANRNKSAIKALGASSKKGKAMAQLITFYPGMKLVLNLLSLLAMIWIACLAALTWGIWAGCFIALVIIALAQLLGARMVPLTDQLLIEQSPFVVKYMSWTKIFNSLAMRKKVEPIEDTDELVELMHDSHIDCPTQMAIEKALYLRSTSVSKLMTKWSDVKKISYKEKLTPVHIDELFQSNQKIFPVIRNDGNDVVGLLHFTDIQTVGQTEKKLLDNMQRNFAICEADATIADTLSLMAENETTVAVVRKKDKVVGLVNLTDIIKSEPVCKN